ncbi:hypothetical protein [Actinoallomurus purpureus]|nr:hypothetical protein [Actinoallomurus purpureus]
MTVVAGAPTAVARLPSQVTGRRRAESAEQIPAPETELVPVAK